MRSHNLFTLIMLSASFLFGSFFINAEPSLEEVVVTARKTDENLRDVPIAISAFTTSEIQDAGIERPEDFIALTPNVVMANTVNVGDTLVTIRGLTSTRDAESNFAFVVDGVLQTNPNGFNRELLDIAQIEVLKGPQGALYGRNATSGAIIITTRQPTEESESSVVFGAGNNSSNKMQGVFSGKLSDNVFGRLTVSSRETDGELVNDFTNTNNVDFFEDTTVRGRLLIDNDDSTWDLRVGSSQAEGGTINFNAVFALPAFQGFGTPGAEKFFLDVNDQEFKYMFNVPPVNEQETFDVSLKFDQDLANGNTLTFIAAYNDLEEHLMSDGTSGAFGAYFGVPSCAASITPTTSGLINSHPPGFSFAAPGTAPSAADTVFGPYLPVTCDGYQYQERNQSDISLELRLTSPQDQDLRWIVGGYVSEIEREVVVAYGADLGRGFELKPYVPPTGKNPTDLLFHDEFNTDVISLFGQLSYDISDRTEISFEARYDQEDRDVENKVPAVAQALSYGGGQPINPGMASVGDSIPSRSEDFSQFQPKLTLTHQASDETSLYASYGVGFRSGGFNSLGSAATTGFWFNTGNPFGLGNVGANIKVKDDFEKEVSKALEIGFKGSYLDGRLALNGAAFQTKIDDNQFFEFFAGPFGLLRVVTTIEELEISGYELDFKFAATDQIRIDGGFGVTDGEIQRNTHRPYTVGNEAPLAPEYTMNLGLQFEQSISDGLELVLRLDYMKIGETWFHTVQDSQQPSVWTALLGFPVASDMSRTVRDPYELLDLRATLRGDHWSSTLWARNLTDEDYLAEVIAAPEFGGSFIHEAPKGTYGIDFRYDF
ncbi:MAG: TonB-dependent receptor [SAR86 cluster bacterium]|nr:TonB-dependent receptor [SAR86 cluster bacterium]